MAPLHHHFEMKGWPEIQIVVRFWIIQGSSSRRRSACSTRSGSGSERSSRSTALRRESSWHGLHAVVAGIGVAGFAAADALLHRRRAVTVVDEPRRRRAARAGHAPGRPWARRSCSAPASTRRSRTTPTCSSSSPGLPPRAPLIRAAAGAGVPVWGELELAWRLRDPPTPAPGCASPAPTARPRPRRCSTRCCAAAGPRPIAGGNIGLPLVDAVMDPDAVDVLAVELSSFAAALRLELQPLGGDVPERRPRPPRLALRSPRRVRRGQGPDLRGHPGRLRLQRRRPRDRAAGRGGRRRRGLPRDRVHPRHAGAVAWSASSTTCSSTGRSSRAARHRRRSWRASTTSRRTRRTTSRTRWPPRRSPVRTASRRRRPRRAAGLPARRAPDRRRRARSRGVRYVDDSKATNAARREGSLLAYDPVVGSPAGWPRARTSTSSCRRVARPAARRRAARRRPRADRRGAGATRARGPVVEVPRTDTGAMEDVVAAAAAAGRAGRHRPARPGVRVVGHVHATTPTAATRSPPRSGPWRSPA